MPKKEKIQQMFDSIAPGYDAFNHLTSLGADRCWRRRALREVVGPRVLDEACGTGDFAIAIARHLADLNRKRPKTEQVPGFRGGPIQKKAENCSGRRISWGTCTENGQKLNRSQVFEGDLFKKRPKTEQVPAISVTGVDISKGMLEVMRRKVAEAGLDDIGCSSVSGETGDCCALGYPDASFDTVTVAFGVRNFEDREKALHEVLRVLRHGGRFVMLELGIPRNPVVRAAYKFYFTRIMPAVGAGISKDKAAYRYLPASVLDFPKPEDWMATMQKTGFAQVRHRSLSLGICNLFTGVRE